MFKDYRDRIAELIRLIATGKASGYDLAELHLLQRMRVESMTPAKLSQEKRADG
jgi:hypothetical protein